MNTVFFWCSSLFGELTQILYILLTSLEKPEYNQPVMQNISWSWLSKYYLVALFAEGNFFLDQKA